MVAPSGERAVRREKAVARRRSVGVPAPVEHRSGAVAVRALAGLEAGAEERPRAKAECQAVAAARRAVVPRPVSVG